MHYGEATLNLDAKNRVFVPKRFQDQLSRTPEGALFAYVTRGQDACLYVFSEAGLQRALDELKSGVFTGGDLRAAQRVFYANTVRIELDASGRLLLPEKLRAHGGLDKEVVMIGVGDRLEIWSKAAWEAYEAEHLDKLDHVDRVLASSQTAPRP
jgi:MraZ protein